MKNGKRPTKRPTKREKIHINSYKLNPENWSIYKSGWTTTFDSSSYELNTSHSKCVECVKRKGL